MMPAMMSGRLAGGATLSRSAPAAVLLAALALLPAGCGPSEPGAADDGSRGPSSDPEASPGPARSASPAPWRVRVVVDSGGGRVGPWRMNESDWRYVDDPTVALDGEGAALTAWVDQARKAVLLQVYGPDGEPRLDRPADVSRSPGIFSWLPRVAAAPGDPDRLHVLWQEIVFSGGTHGGEAFYARSADGGRSFSEPVNLSRSEAGDGKGRITGELWFNGSLALAVAPGGRVYAAWTAYEGALWLARSTDGGASFSDPVRVGGSGSAPARGPDLAVGPGDTVRVIWSAGAGGGADLRLAVSDDAGRSFGEPRRVHPGPDHDDAPKLVVAADGTLHLAWGRSPAGPFGPSRVMYARSPGGSAFGPPRRISSAHGERFTSVDYPELALAGGDTVLVAWALFPSGPRFSRGLGLAASVDGGDRFLAPAVVPGTRPAGEGVTGSLQGFFRDRLAVGPGGAAALVYSTFRRGASSRIWLLRGATAEVVGALAPPAGAGARSSPPDP